MSEQKKSPTPSSPQEEPSYTPASPVKRAMAWIGLVYAFMLLGMTTYIFYTGTALGNLGPLLALPALIGLGAVALISHRTTGTPGKGAAVFMALLCWAVALYTVPLAWVGLMSNFGG